MAFEVACSTAVRCAGGGEGALAGACLVTLKLGIEFPPLACNEGCEQCLFARTVPVSIER